MKRLLYDHTLTLLIHYVQVGGWRGGVDRGLVGVVQLIFLNSWYIVLPLSGTASFAGRHLCQTLIYEYSYYFSYCLSITFFCSLLFLIVFFFFLSLISNLTGNLLGYTPATIDCFFLYSLALPFTSHLK